VPACTKKINKKCRCLDEKKEVDIIHFLMTFSQYLVKIALFDLLSHFLAFKKEIVA